MLSSKGIPDVESYTSVEECIKTLDGDGTEKLFVIGGSTVYRNFIHRSDELHITHVDELTEGIDTYFPVTILKIQKEFEQIEERALSDNAVYSRWVKSKM